MVAVTTNANAPHMATMMTMRCIRGAPARYKHSADPCGCELALRRRRSARVKLADTAQHVDASKGQDFLVTTWRVAYIVEPKSVAALCPLTLT